MFILTSEQVAKWLHCSERTVKKMASKGQIPCYKLGNRFRFNVTELEKWINQNTEQNAV
jgi:excisionase family DNA binding protein